MKKSMMMVVALSGAVLQAMEIDFVNSIVGKTKINFSQGNMYETYAKSGKNVDLVVVGKFGQANYDPMQYGTSSLSEKEKEEIRNFIQQQKDNNCCVIAQEPMIWISHEDQKYCCNGDGHLLKNDDALNKTCERLQKCYNDALIEGLKKLKEEKNKSIGLPMLCTDLTQTWSLPYGYAVCAAMAAIVEFIQKNSEQYDRIELFGEEGVLSNVYKNILQGHTDAK